VRLLGVETVTKPVKLPVTPQEFIDHGRLNGITVGLQPDLIDRELAAATRRAERYLRRSLITQTLRAYYAQDNLPCDATILLPRGSVQSVTSVTSDGTVIDPVVYKVIGSAIVLSSVLYAPAETVWVSGYGDEPEDVPDIIKEGILEYALALYDDRTGSREPKFAAGGATKLPRGIEDLWRPEQIEVSG
jgi:uncharacterized phiE125 gp8 family phage protein